MACYQFKENGSCKFGEECRFIHGEGDARSRAPAAPRAARPAPAFQECYAFRDGDCKFGNACRFSHGAEDARPQDRNARKKERGPCWKFKENNDCEYGDECRFAHGDNDNRPPPPLGDCFEFRDNGVCRFGNNCRFGHAN